MMELRLSWMGIRRYMVRRQSLPQSFIHGRGEAQSCANYVTEEALLSCSVEVRAVESFYELSAYRPVVTCDESSPS